MSLTGHALPRGGVHGPFGFCLAQTFMCMRLFLLSVLLTVLLPLSAQQRGWPVSGQVLDDRTGQPIVGATVIIKGTKAGALTQEEGRFSYAIPEPEGAQATLVVRFLGYQPQEVPVNGRQRLTIRLVPKEVTTQEVVITSSYGTTKLREDVVGSISTVMARDIQTEQAAESVDKLLVGQIAGVQIENSSSVGGPIAINIRGQGSLTPLSNAVLGTSTQPLIIVDGVILNEEGAIDNEFFDGSGSFTEDFQNPLVQISPDQIESISVLKDAAAVGIYGADGANGVIIITTKRGKRGKPRVTVSSQLGISEAINRIKYLNGAQYNELRNEYLINTGAQPVPYNGVDTDWFELLNRRGLFQRYSANLSGGGQYLTYRVGLNFLGIAEPQVGNGTQQYRVSAGLRYSRGKWQADLSANQSLFIKNSPNVFFNYAFAPTLAPYDNEGDFAPVGVRGLGNPLAGIAQNRNRSESWGTLGSLSLRYQILKGWDVSSLFGLDYKDKTQDRYFSGDNESGQLNGSFLLDGVEYPLWGRRVINDRQSTRWNWQSQSSFQRSWAETHSFDALAGVELAQEQTDFAYAAGRGFVNPGPINPVEAAVQDDDPATREDDRFANQTYNQDVNNNARVSLYAQANYNFRKKYYILANFRRDQSSVFGDDTDVTYNGGAGVSWVLMREPWLANQSWIDFLRLRASYGSTGNSRIGSYRSKGLFNVDDVGGYNNLPIGILSSSAPPNDRLTWETNLKFNLGLDFNFLNVVNLTVDFFRDHLQDLITSRSLPTETGYSSAQINAASMINQGVETSLNLIWVDREDFRWNTSVNVATLRSEVTELVGLGSSRSTSQQALAQQVGYSTSTIWGVRWAGIDPATGRDLVIYRGPAGFPGELMDAATYRARFGNSAWEPLGDRQPRHYGGFSNVMSYKGFSFSMRGTYQWGGYLLVNDDLVSNYNITVNRNLSVNAYDYWRGPGDYALQPVVTRNNPVIPNLSKYMYDLSYVKLSNVNLGYRFDLTEPRLGLRSLSVSADVTNVLYWYRVPSPEGRNGVREFRFTYPEARTWSLALKAGF
ncbi:MAG: SusC/RagA family TonB-linked outer membrane protein [Bacteroidetes bacterium]|nr:MAG: SusC/RagA family TonB-linked outer membrane protein [Bacteroidota bacterium]